MDNMEELSDVDGPNTSCRIDHDNSMNNQVSDDESLLQGFVVTDEMCYRVA